MPSATVYVVANTDPRVINAAHTIATITATLTQKYLLMLPNPQYSVIYAQTKPPLLAKTSFNF
jgi:hypothetical protein